MLATWLREQGDNLHRIGQKELLIASGIWRHCKKGRKFNCTLKPLTLNSYGILVPRHDSGKCGGFSVQKHFDDWAGKAPQDKWPDWTSKFACLIFGERTEVLWTPGNSKVNSKAQACSLADLWKKMPALLRYTVWARASKILILSKKEYYQCSLSKGRTRIVHNMAWFLPKIF